MQLTWGITQRQMHQAWEDAFVLSIIRAFTSPFFEIHLRFTRQGQLPVM